MIFSYERPPDPIDVNYNIVNVKEKPDETKFFHRNPAKQTNNKEPLGSTFAVHKLESHIEPLRPSYNNRNIASQFQREKISKLNEEIQHLINSKIPLEQSYNIKNLASQLETLDVGYNSDFGLRLPSSVKNNKKEKSYNIKQLPITGGPIDISSLNQLGPGLHENFPAGQTSHFNIPQQIVEAEKIEDISEIIQPRQKTIPRPKVGKRIKSLQHQSPQPPNQYFDVQQLTPHEIRTDDSLGNKNYFTNNPPTTVSKLVPESGVSNVQFSTPPEDDGDSFNIHKLQLSDQFTAPPPFNVPTPLPNSNYNTPSQKNIQSSNSFNDRPKFSKKNPSDQIYGIEIPGLQHSFIPETNTHGFVQTTLNFVSFRY